jgi:hypothetical protein
MFVQAPLRCSGASVSAAANPTILRRKCPSNPAARESHILYRKFTAPILPPFPKKCRLPETKSFRTSERFNIHRRFTRSKNADPLNLSTKGKWSRSDRGN